MFFLYLFMSRFVSRDGLEVKVNAFVAKSYFRNLWQFNESDGKKLFQGHLVTNEKTFHET